MTKDEIMTLARRVGFPMSNPDWQKAVEEFAALCCEVEREECARVCEDLDAFDYDDPGSSAASAIRAMGNP